MKDFLAERLLAAIMEWSPDEISKERPLLQALGSLKYNDYQQFSTGVRFIESLVRWLQQFKELEERRIAYKFLINHLIFISNEQMAYLVSIVFNEKINPVIIRKTANELRLKEHFVTKISKSAEYQSNLRKSIFIGLSDGSRIDFLRRSSNLNNEQVSTTHEISREKIMDMLNELEEAQKGKCKFHTVFLIDDFTASGKSFFRPEEGKGKLWKFLDKIFGVNSHLTDDQKNWKELVDADNLDIHVLFYIATQEAIENIQKNIDKWKISINISNNIKVYAVQILNSSIKASIENNVDLIELTKKYFDTSIVNKHYKKGKHDNPHLGFNECGLPLILSHNTPNNSLPILWLPDDMIFNGLFPRVTRHK